MDEVLKGNLTVSGNDSGTTTAKAVAMVVLFCSTFVLGSIPIKLAKWFQWKSDAKNHIYVQMLLCMGGGVLLFTTFLHLLPEVEEGIEDSEISSSFKSKLGKMLMCIGFFLMYFIEECVHLYLHSREKNKGLEVIRRSVSIRRGETNSHSEEDNIKSLEEGNKSKDNHDHTHHHQHDHNEHSHVVIEDGAVLSTIRGLLIVLALGVHEIFEGLAIGLESSTNQVWYMFGAVSAHKLVIAFCIGVEMVTSQIRVLLIIVYIFVFAIVSPIGIGIGIGLSENGGTNDDMPSVILQGLATGTLLYVVFFEILQDDRKRGLKQYFSVLFGFLVMFGLSMLDDD